MENPPLSLYIHIPFCRQKCAYCSFYSESEGDISEYVEALIRCIGYHRKTARAREISTVYIGGGTPSLIPPHKLSRLFCSILENFSVSAAAEITIEANPESCTPEFLECAVSCGVNRLSLGVQSLCDSELKRIGRLHSAQEAVSAVKSARKSGFENISCDLIFGLPGQSAESFAKSVDGLISLDTKHISCYNLQLEKGTPLYKSGAALPDEREQEQMYFHACSALGKAGYTHYEISNFAKSGFESRHNSVYWTENDYLGLGAAAHSRIGGYRYSFMPDRAAFIKKTEFGFDKSEKIDDPLLEKIMLSLRTLRGLEISLLPNSAQFIARLVENGLARTADGRLILTERGFLLSNTIMATLAAAEC